jgi:hypothetical protein
MSGQISNPNFTFFPLVFNLKHPLIYSLITIPWFTFFQWGSYNFSQRTYLGQDGCYFPTVNEFATFDNSFF